MNTRFVLLVTLFAAVALAADAALPAAEQGYDTPEGLAKLIREGKPDHLLVDVRTPAEYEAGHIPTAINVPVDVIGTKPPTDRTDLLIVVYCRSGNRSATARRILVDLGYTNVVDFGAVSNWTGTLILGKEPGALPK